MNLCEEDNSPTGEFLKACREEANQALSCSAPAAGSVPVEIAEELCVWVEACLACKDWHWSPDQQEAAEFAVRQFQQFKEQNDPPHPRGE